MTRNKKKDEQKKLRPREQKEINMAKQRTRRAIKIQKKGVKRRKAERGTHV